MNWIKTLSKYVLAILLIVAGSMHFVRPDLYVKIVPSYLPFHFGLVLLSGVCEVVLGILLLLPRFSRFAGWGMVALFIAVFPANLYLYQHQEIFPASPALHLLRLPLQGVLILWAYWHTTTARDPIA